MISSLRPGVDGAGVGARATASTSCSAAAPPRRSRTSDAPAHAVADGRALLRVRALVTTGGRSRRARLATSAIRIEGRVLDGAGDARARRAWSRSGRPTREGRYDSSWGWGRCATDADGHFAFTTVKPGAVREPEGPAGAPCRPRTIFARGLLKPVLTRIYFADEDAANAGDPVLSSIADAAERADPARGADGRCRLSLRREAPGRRPDGLLHDARVRPMTFSRLKGPDGAPVVVLSNSLGTTLEMWEPQVPALSAHFGVLRYHHPGHGHGRSDPPISSVAELGRGVLGDAGRARAPARLLLRPVAGWRGGHVARHACPRAHRPARAGLHLGAAFGKRENWLQRAATVRSCGMEAIADAVLALWFTPRTHRTVAALASQYRAMMISDPARRLRGLLRGAGRLGAR